MKRLLLSIALVSIALLVGDVMAEKPEKGAKGKRANASQARRGPGGPPRDPAKMVARIMGEFDKDGDEKLDKTELASWLKAMHQRRGQGMRRGGKGRQGKPGAERKRNRGGQQSGTPGGDLPKRPEAE